MSNSPSNDRSQDPDLVSDLDNQTIPHPQPGLVAGQTRKHSDELPQSFGRYRVISMLGQGGFGCVYKAIDEQLERDVAIKVTLSSLVDPAIRQGFLTEARIVASLDHPNIVPVYDVGQTDQGDFYVISKLISGSDLATRLKTDRPGTRLSLSIVEAIAEALHHAHSHGLVHRDIKPANILLDRNDRPYLADFGIALRESERGKQGESAGTPAYMSPEQARAEGHRVDNRSDIYSLGVVLYELLTGRRPFRSENALEMMSLIASGDVRSPRVYDDNISKDLERICLKALARRSSERYTVARDFAEDIRWTLTHQSYNSTVSLDSHHTPTSGVTPSVAFSDTTEILSPDTSRISTDSHRTGPTLVVPKGLRSFDASDAGFFLQLLPGPFDREGLPETLRFWKDRVEQIDSDQTFRVGLIYGPSGCGKSSLVKAGLLPRLSPKVVAIYLEAHAEETESRLLKAVRKAIPEAEGQTLKEVLGTIRRRKLVPSGGKLLLVLDQFEQWLFSEKDYTTSNLTEALRQCDGGIVQAIIMVRDDFWISVSRFLRELDIPILERENSTLVDLFDLQHAEKVLRLFGRSYGKLPDSPKDWTEDQQQFIKQAVIGLSQDRKVISVRLAVFAEMMKSRDWTPAALREVGGIEGVGVTFLEETFSSRHAQIQHRQHQDAARGLLSSLLPISGTDIKGTMCSAEELMNAAGYERKPKDFEQLLQILDKSLRLITPVDADSFSLRGEESLQPSAVPQTTLKSTHYQLTHDFLVPSLRDWLTQKQRESRKGRAALKLAERASVWNVKQEPRHLPSLLEWGYMRWATDAKLWTDPQRHMMRTAAKWHLRTWSTVGLALLALVLGLGYVFRSQEDRFRQQQAINQIKTVKDLVEALQASSGTAIEVNLQKLKDPGLVKLVLPVLKQKFQDASDPKSKLALAFGLASFGDVQVDYLMSRIHELEDADISNMIRALGMNPEASAKAISEAYTETTKIIEELDKRPAWSDDPPLETFKEQVSKQDISAIELAGGLVDERFAVCQSMSWQTFLSTVESMKRAGYRPVKIRPHRTEGKPIQSEELMVAAVWLRDGKLWKWEKGLNKEETIERNRILETEQFSLQDIAGYISDVGDARYVGVWVQEAKPWQSNLVFVQNASEVKKQADDFSPKHLYPATWHAFKAPNRQIHHVVSFTDGLNKLYGYWYGSRRLIESKINDSSASVDLGMYDNVAEYTSLDSLELLLVQREKQNIESEVLLLLTPEEHLVKIRKLIDDGFRPVSIATQGTTNLIKTSSIWERPTEDSRATRVKNDKRTVQYRRQARLALLSLGTGDMSLANQTVDFIAKSTHEPRGWFIKDLAKLGPKIEKYLYQFANTHDAATRSALCLAFGQLPKQGMTEELYNSIVANANAWYSQPDRATHSSAAWLLRRLGETVPSNDEKSNRSAEQEWLVNSRGMSMILVKPKQEETELTLPDPLEKYRRRLEVAKDLDKEIGEKTKIHYELGVSLYHLERYEEALQEFEQAEPHLLSVGMLDMYRSLTLAKLHREPEAERALKRFVATQSKIKWKLKFYHWKPEGSAQTPNDWQEVLQSPVIAETETEKLSLYGGVNSSPAKDVKSDYFAVVASATIPLPDQPYTVEFSFDDGIRVSLDDRVVLEKWAVNQEDSAKVVLEGTSGEHQLKVEYFHAEGRHKLEWESPNRNASSFIDYTNILVPSLGGNLAEGKRRFSDIFSQKEKLDQSELYNLARAGALLATSLRHASGEYDEVLGNTLDLLELWMQGSDASQSQLNEEPDFAGIRNQSRFRRLSDLPKSPTMNYWFASREVSRSDFQAFLSDDSYIGEKAVDWKPDDSMGLEASLTGEHPIQNLTWYEAVMFCNWLSQKEGLSPAYYLNGKETLQFTDDNSSGAKLEVDRWILDPNQDGYRLPTQLEWEFACRAGTKTYWCSGNNESLLADYSQIYPSKQPTVCCSKMPNAWGLHDLHGNVWEWCQDSYMSYTSDNAYRAIRGGCSHRRPDECYYSSSGYPQTTTRSGCIGFRVARTATEKGSSSNRTAMK